MIPDASINNICRKTLERFSFFKRIRSYFNTYISLNSGLVYLQRADLRELPPLWEISPLFLKEMSINDESQVNEWLRIINQSFSRTWNREEYVKNIINHEIYEILYTYLLMDGEKYIGVVSEAIFKRNKQVGVTHYIGLDKYYLGRGLGKYLILYTLHKMREHNLKSCEAETTLDHKRSIFIHFDLGFSPKTKLNHWNTMDRTYTLKKIINNYRLKRFYYKWKRKKSQKILSNK